MTLALICVGEAFALLAYVCCAARERCTCHPGGRSCVCPFHGENQR